MLLMLSGSVIQFSSVLLMKLIPGESLKESKKKKKVYTNNSFKQLQWMCHKTFP